MMNTIQCEPTAATRLTIEGNNMPGAISSKEMPQGAEVFAPVALNAAHSFEKGNTAPR
jgi:hypothetical protein